jgi:S-adenosylmethionine/arginine decarboxylase-like enzyme
MSELLELEPNKPHPAIDTDDIFGWELILDIYQCNPTKVRSIDEIVAFIKKLCSEVLDIKLHGETWAEWFGQHRPVNTGYTVVQLVETSSVIAHFSELKNSVYLEIFSCKPYDPAVVSNFCRDFFEAEKVVEHFLERR